VKGFIISPIGHVTNNVHDVRFDDWKNLISRLVIDEMYVEGLDGIEQFSHLLVVSRLHLPGKLLLKRHPRDRRDLPVVGIFATRSQLRPNRLGLHLVRLLERKRNVLLVKGLDAVDGTPLVDIKPYIPQLDIETTAAVPEWVNKLDVGRRASRRREIGGPGKEGIVGTSFACEKCGKEVGEQQRHEHLGRSYCEDCYMDILSPPKACDPWAVYAAKCSLQGNDKFAALTPGQRRIVDYIRAKGEATVEEVMEHLGLTAEEFKREFAVLRHMEVLKGLKKGPIVVYTLFDA
jgi:tRNA-Thr(GGU) m(6)t(6)A37 methyltransferase TsaA